MFVGVAATTASLALLLALPVPYILETPGPTVDTLGEYEGTVIIQVDVEPSHPITGELRLTTVGAYGVDPGTLSAVELVGGYLNPDDAVLPYDLVYSRDSTAEEREAESADQMTSSQDSAAVAAFEYLGLEVGILVGEAVSDSAKAALKADDRIVAINGQPVSGYNSLTELMGKVTAGDSIQLTVERAGKQLTVTVVTEAEQGSNRALIGISVAFDFPFEIEFGVGDIGGPSAGSMLALGIIDKLGTSDLAAGRVIAGTGTISPNGQIGSIGGIVQKMAAARRDGATVFLAPAANCAEAASRIPDGLQVVKVETLTEAVDALAALARGEGGSLATCTR
jgi:PDZ domain-containing protein